MKLSLICLIFLFAYSATGIFLKFFMHRLLIFEISAIPIGVDDEFGMFT